MKRQETIKKLKNLSRNELSEYIKTKMPKGPGTLYAEYVRTIEMFKEVCEHQDAYLALAVLVDGQYNQDELRIILNMWHTLRI